MSRSPHRFLFHGCPVVVVSPSFTILSPSLLFLQLLGDQEEGVNFLCSVKPFSFDDSAIIV